MSHVDPKRATGTEPKDGGEAEAREAVEKARIQQAGNMSYWARKMRQYLPEPEPPSADEMAPKDGDDDPEE